MRGIKIPHYEFALKMQGGAYARRGAYLRDTTVVWIVSSRFDNLRFFIKFERSGHAEYFSF